MYSLWDRWEIQGDPSCTLRQFMKLIEVGINFSNTNKHTITGEIQTATIDGSIWCKDGVRASTAWTQKEIGPNVS